MTNLILILLMCILLLSPIVLTILNIMNMFRNKKIKPNIVDGLIIVLGVIFTVSLYIFCSFKDYQVALYVPNMDILEYHAPISSWNLPTIITISIISIISYIITRIYKLRLSPILIVICISGMMMGCVISILWYIQLSKNIYNIIVNYFLLFPFNYIVCCISITRTVMNEYNLETQNKEYNNLLMNKFNKIIKDSKKWPLLAFLLMIPMLLVIFIILTLFGQEPDSIIKAFTQTSDWTLSKEISPPPIEHDAHYLCTVSLRGHNNIVKPLRYGIRNNQKIVVNRQLCVANAFEQLIQEKTPNIHRLIRSFYDKYGYPLSKHITSPISADVTYVLMKPLEYFFVFVLYLFDNKPENRIARQYLRRGNYLENNRV